jgi:hypothetical protein
MDDFERIPVRVKYIGGVVAPLDLLGDSVIIPGAQWLAPEEVRVNRGLMAESNEKVDEFYSAAISAGARDNISPRARMEYYPGLANIRDENILL